MNWFQKLTPEQERENRLLRQWRQARLQTRLELLPVELLVKAQLSNLAATQRAALLPRASSSPSTLPKVNRNVARRIKSASASVVATLSRRPCLQPLRRVLVNSRRRVMLFLLVRALRLVRWSLRHQASRGRRS